MTSLNVDIPSAFSGLFDMSYRHQVYVGGRGSGKSHSIAEASIILSSTRKRRVVCARQFQSSIKDSSKSLLEKKIFKFGLNDSWKVLETELIHRTLDSRYSFIGLERSANAAKSLDGVDELWCEEAGDLNENSMETIIPTIRDQGSRIIWSYNPRYRTDPVDNLFRGMHVPEKSLVKFVTYQDNPYFFNTELATERRNMMLRNPERAKYIWDGGYDENSKAQIFTNTRIGRVELPDHAYPLFGMDFGFSESPNVLIKIYLLPETNTLYIAQEMFCKLPTRHLAEVMDAVSESREYPIIADSSRPETIDHLVNDGFNVRASKKGAGSVASGINWLKGLDIVIDPDCVNMQEEARRYFWRLDPQNNPLPVPVPSYDHGWDAVRYAVQDHMIRFDPNDSGVVKIAQKGRR